MNKDTQIISENNSINSSSNINFPVTFIYKQVAAGSRHTCLISNNHIIMCFGASYLGQTIVPLDVINPSIIDSKWNHTCTIYDNTHNLKCFGDNDNYNRQNDIPDGFRTNVLDVSTGNNHTCCIIKNTYKAKCWGSNIQGQTDIDIVN